MDWRGHWWHEQNLEGPLRGPDGRSWHFLVWYGWCRDLHFQSQRIFFWDEARSETGVIVLNQNETLHVRKIRDRQRKIARDATYREKWLQPLEFPIERHFRAPNIALNPDGYAAG
jgi:hypothetical protein